MSRRYDDLYPNRADLEREAADAWKTAEASVPKGYAASAMASELASLGWMAHPDPDSAWGRKGQIVLVPPRKFYRGFQP